MPAGAPHHTKTGLCCFKVISKRVGDISSHSKGIVSQTVLALFTKLFLPTLSLLKSKNEMQTGNLKKKMDGDLFVCVAFYYGSFIKKYNF